MPRWLVVLLSVLLFCAVAIAAGGWFAFRWTKGEFSSAIENTIAETTEASVLATIQAQDRSPVDLQISQRELDINTVEGPEGTSGFDISVSGESDRAVIYGATTTIDGSGITVRLADTTYVAVPVASAGRIELTDRRFDKGVSGWIISAEAIETGLERGINDAFAGARLKPVSVSLGLGLMKITTEPV